MASSMFDYSISRPYPFRWFTPVVIVGGAIALVLFSFLNLVSTGYYLRYYWALALGPLWNVLCPNMSQCWECRGPKLYSLERGMVKSLALILHDPYQTIVSSRGCSSKHKYFSQQEYRVRISSFGINSVQDSSRTKLPSRIPWLELGQQQQDRI